MSLWQDLRYAVRMLALSPAFTAVAVVSLALGIGANSAIFGLINSVLLKYLPVERPQELVQVTMGKSLSFTNPIWEELNRRQQGLSGVFAFSPGRFNLSTEGEVDNARGLFISGSYFPTLGVRPQLGRLIGMEDDIRGGGKHGPVAVLSYPFWQKRYGGDPTALGKTIHLDGQSFQIIGVTPPDFFGLNVGQGFDAAVPIATEPLLFKENSKLDRRSTWWLSIFGRRKPSESLSLAQDKLKAVAPGVFEATLPPDWPVASKANYLKTALGLQPAFTGTSFLRNTYRDSLYVLMAVVGAVLLIACANLANLLLARAAAREREIAVRMALGAGRGRLIRQLLTESLLLASLGCLLGIAFAQWGSRLMVRYLSTADSVVFLDLSPDWRVTGFTVAVTAVTGLLFGIAPAFRATGLPVNSVLKQGGRGAGASRLTIDRILVVSQTALSLVLVIGAGLFLRSFYNLSAVDKGFRTSHILTASLDLRKTASTPQRRYLLYKEILDRLHTLPGVKSAAQTDIIPISGAGWNNTIQPLGVPELPDSKREIWLNRVSSRYFETMGTPLLAGRNFESTDSPASQPVALINEAAVKKFFPDSSPIGKLYRQTWPPGEKPVQIIGIVKDAKYRRLTEPAPPTAYLFSGQDQAPRTSANFLIHTPADASQTAAAVTQSLLQLDPGIAVQYRSFETQVNDSLARERLLATLSGFFGALALLLAAIGLYGLMSFALSRRRGEIGIRLALGAQPGSVLRMILREAALLCMAGVMAGSLAALAGTRFLSSLLFGVKPTDAVTLAAAATLLLAVGGIAGFLPARRAANLNPMIVLREQ